MTTLSLTEQPSATAQVLICTKDRSINLSARCIFIKVLEIMMARGEAPACVPITVLRGKARLHECLTSPIEYLRAHYAGVDNAAWLLAHLKHSRSLRRIEGTFRGSGLLGFDALAAVASHGDSVSVAVRQPSSASRPRFVLNELLSRCSDDVWSHLGLRLLPLGTISA